MAAPGFPGAVFFCGGSLTRGICGVWRCVRPARLGFTRHIALLCTSLQPGASEPHTPPAIRISPGPAIPSPIRRAAFYLFTGNCSLSPSFQCHPHLPTDHRPRTKQTGSAGLRFLFLAPLSSPPQAPISPLEPQIYGFKYQKCDAVHDFCVKSELYLIESGSRIRVPEFNAT